MLSLCQYLSLPAFGKNSLAPGWAKIRLSFFVHNAFENIKLVPEKPEYVTKSAIALTG